VPKLRVLSGDDVVKIFEQLGFWIANQKGSHVKLKRKLNNNTEHCSSQRIGQGNSQGDL